MQSVKLLEFKKIVKKFKQIIEVWNREGSLQNELRVNVVNLGSIWGHFFG